MRKYQIAEGIGCFLVSIAIIIGLFSMTIDTDLDYTYDAYKYILIGWGIAAGIALLGVGLMYLSLVEGILVTVFVLLCATIYRIIKAPVKFLHLCYQVKEKYGPNYKHAFLGCVDAYDRYIDKKREEAILSGEQYL